MRRNREVLVVEDDEVQNIQLCRLMRRHGFAFRAALDGDSAFEQARECPPSLILLDVMLPGTGGFELGRRFKADPITQHIPVVMVTALDADADRQRGLEAGASAYLIKPCKTQQLLELIRQLLPC